MFRLRILSIGKTKEQWLDEAIGEYQKRLQNTASIEFILVKNNEQLLHQADKESSLVCLDAAGKTMDSVQFSSFLMKQLIAGGSRLTLIIGGADGLPKELKMNYPLISLSPMTFTHQIVRLVLVEQIYRAFEIVKGTGYHK